MSFCRRASAGAAAGELEVRAEDSSAENKVLTAISYLPTLSSQSLAKPVR